MPGQGVEGVHDVFDRGVAVDVAVGGEGLLGPGHQLGVGHRHQGGGVVGAGEQAQVQGAVVEHLGHRAQVADLDAERGRAHAERHLGGQRRAGGVHATAHTAGTGGDVDGVAGVTAFEDDLIAPEEHGPGVGVDGPAVLQVQHRVHGEGAGHPGHGVDVPVPQAGRGGQLGTGALLAAHIALGLGQGDGVGVGDPVLQLGLTARVELDRQILEAHASASPWSLCGRTSISRLSHL